MYRNTFGTFDIPEFKAVCRCQHCVVVDQDATANVLAVKLYGHLPRPPAWLRVLTVYDSRYDANVIPCVDTHATLYKVAYDICLSINVACTTLHNCSIVHITQVSSIYEVNSILVLTVVQFIVVVSCSVSN